MSSVLAAVLLLQAAQANAAPQRPPPSTTDMPGWSRAPMVHSRIADPARLTRAASGG